MKRIDELLTIAFGQPRLHAGMLFHERGEQMRQLGNAVPVELGRVFTQAVAGALPTES